MATFTAGQILTAANLNTVLPDASVTWAPTVGGVTKGNGTETAKYYRTGSTLVCCFYRFSFGSTSAITGDVTVTHPFTSIALISGRGYLLDSGTTQYDASVTTTNTTNVVIRPVVASGTYATVAQVMSSTIPMTWTTNDEINATWMFITA
jgi:hypothetical protein